MLVGRKVGPREGRHVRSVVVTVALAYLLFTLVALFLHGMSPLWFVWLDDEFHSTAPAGSIGYDGQFVYAIAVDGLDAASKLDNPAYRLQRILLPALAGALAFGQESLVPWTILAVNLFAVVFAAGLLAWWLASNKTSPWYALIYPFYVGTVMAYSRDLTEPLMAALVIAGILAWESNRPIYAIALMALASLAKETALVFVAALAIHSLLKRDPLRLLWASVSALPAILWQAFLAVEYSRIPFFSGPPMSAIWPLAGILGQLSWDPGRLFAFLTVAIPAVALTLSAMWRLGEDPTVLEWWLVLLNALALLFLPADVYDHIMHAGRNAIGLVLSMVLCVPFLSAGHRRLAAVWLCAPSLIWLVPILRWTPWP